MSKRVPLRTACDRVVNHVFRTGLTGNVTWAWSVERVTRVQQCETKFMRMTFKNAARDLTVGDDILVEEQGRLGDACGSYQSVEVEARVWIP